MIFPDEITLCGPAVLYIDWAQPGLDIAKKVWVQIERFKAEYAMPPRVIVMQNHGLIALGQRRINSSEVDFFAKFGERQTTVDRMADAYYLLGLGYLGKRLTDQAKEMFSESVRLNLNHVWASYFLSENQKK